MGDPSSRISKQHLTTFGQRKDTPIHPSQHTSSTTHSSITASKNIPPALLAPFPAKTLQNRLQSVPTGPPYISPLDETPSQEDPHLRLQFGSPNQPKKVLPSRIVRSSSSSCSSPTWKWNGTNVHPCSNMLLCFQYLLAKLSMDKYMTYDL